MLGGQRPHKHVFRCCRPMVPKARVPPLPADGPTSTCSAAGLLCSAAAGLPCGRACRLDLAASSHRGAFELPMQNGRNWGTSCAKWPLRASKGGLIVQTATEVVRMRPNCNRSRSGRLAGRRGGGWCRLSARQAGSRETGGHAKRPPGGGFARGRRACETTARGGFARGGWLARGGQMCERRRKAGMCERVSVLRGAGRCERRVSYTANGDPVGPPSRKGADVVRRSAGARALARRWRSGASGCWPTAPFQALP